MRVYESGTTICGRYQILGLAGRGGMGAVYAACDSRLGLTVALKQTFATDEGLRRAFRREGRLLAALRHPCLPRVLDHFEDGGELFLAMEYVPGDDLGAMLAQRDGPFPMADVWGWADALLDALEYLHRQSPPVVHRDIKPQNLKLAAGGGVVLLDFGLARGAAGGQTLMLSGATVAGYTLSYAPIEQIQGGAVDARADLYALGATLYHLLSGKAPVDALARAVARLDGDPDPLPPLGAVRPELPVALCNVVMGALALRGADRPATATELRDGLRAAGCGDISPPSPAPVRRSRRWVLWAAAPALALALVVGLGAVRAAAPAGAAPAPDLVVVTESAVPTVLPSPVPTVIARPSPSPSPLPVPPRGSAQSPAESEPVDAPTATDSPTATAIPTAAPVAPAKPRPAATARPRPAATVAPPPIPIIPVAP